MGNFCYRLLILSIHTIYVRYQSKCFAATKNVHINNIALFICSPQTNNCIWDPKRDVEVYKINVYNVEMQIFKCKCLVSNVRTK